MWTSSRSALAGVLVGFAAACAFFAVTRSAAQGQAQPPAQRQGQPPPPAPAKAGGQGAGRQGGRGGGPPAETSIPDKVRLFIPYRDYTQADNQKILDVYKWLRVADVSDGMDTEPQPPASREAGSDAAAQR